MNLSMNKEVIIDLLPDYCCGGGHCGILPGYNFNCPNCSKPTGCRTGDYLNIGECLVCFLCKGKFKAIEELEEFKFLFRFEGIEEKNQTIAE